ncbi:hypothetical protein F511_28648 [Dorcoceras hygrometricum]|uniref:Retrotransposon Copia-like N-terminal domain-containing protein n=1 Tax=Dorcoceras hygrometricum TaxID=472368 RepID=A0A2Z7AKD7_9LAMI|nr:hypothetical protein F511_28648 [Dorcoceras hygrometricum]
MNSSNLSSSSDVVITPVATPHGLRDASPRSITAYKLTGRNFISWSQSVMMYIYGRGKDNFLTGMVLCPEAGDPKFQSWKSDNSMVILWLINLISPEIGENLLLYPTAKDIWMEVHLEESRCKVMLGTSLNSTALIDGSALASHRHHISILDHSSVPAAVTNPSNPFFGKVKPRPALV